MQTDPPPPRRNWHLKRWFTVLVIALFVLAIAVFAWSGWRVADQRAAIKEAEALGWSVRYTDPSKEIRADWRNAFRTRTWTDGVTFIYIPTNEAFTQSVRIVHRLNPKDMTIDHATTFRDFSDFVSLSKLRQLSLSRCWEISNVDGIKILKALESVALTDCTMLSNIDGLKHLAVLEVLSLEGCTGLTNLDALKNLTALNTVVLTGCTGLSNVDALKGLSALQTVVLTGCTGLTRESVEALKAALPNTNIIEP